MPGLLMMILPADSFLAVVPLLAVWQGVWPYLLMLLGFSVIIFVHELGHFAVAKWAGIRVERFAIGFGKELAGFTRGETRYSFNVLPLGGYVKMLGQEDFDDKANELRFNDDPRSFVNKPVSHRMAVVSAGVVMNILFACLLFMFVFMVGMKAIGTRIGFVEPDSPADKAGLLPGDDIKRINDEQILEFRDITMAIMLAPPHEPIQFDVERDGKPIAPVYVKPDYRRPDNTREARRQVIGIMNGFTREVVWVGPGLQSAKANEPKVGDVIVEVDGVAVTDQNANEVRNTLAYASEIYVERKDPKHPDAGPKRIRVDVPPQLALYPSNPKDKRTISVLGLIPLVRFGIVNPAGRAYLAGIEIGDTILSWDDQPHPTKADIDRSVRDSAERDIPYRVRKPDGKVLEGFVRPKRVRLGGATIQAIVESIDATDAEQDQPRARFSGVRPGRRAALAGIESGDLILTCNQVNHPSRTVVRAFIRANAGEPVTFTVQKADGSILRTVVYPDAPGSLDASYSLVADDLMETGDIDPIINGQPSPAAEAGIPPGVRITEVNGETVTNWRALIDAFRRGAGTSVALAYITSNGERNVATFPVPSSLRTMLGVGPEARIVSIDGHQSVKIHTGRGPGGFEKVHVGYHEGTRTLLTELIGRSEVPVVFRPTPLAPPQTAHIAVTADMVDPWVGRIAFAPNIDVGPELKILKGKNMLDAIRIGIHKTYIFIRQVYETMNRMIFSRSVGVEAISGPLGIVSVGGQIARAGIVEFLFFLAIISANLAVINFLPLPIVDGGLMLFLIIEKIKGSPVSLRVQVATQMVGIFLIIGMFLFVTYQDILRLIG